MPSVRVLKGDLLMVNYVVLFMDYRSFTKVFILLQRSKTQLFSKQRKQPQSHRNSGQMQSGLKRRQASNGRDGEWEEGHGQLVWVENMLAWPV